MVSDEQLVEASLNGRAAAFDQLVDRYQDRLLRFLLTRSASHADAEDAVQDTFINAYRYLSSFNPQWRFSTWIYRIALRNLGRQKRPELQESSEILVSKDDPLRACIENSERENVWITAKQILSDEVYAAMWLRYVEDLSVKEVSRALDKSHSWTKVNLLRARRKLAGALNEISETEKTPRESYG